MLLVEGYPRSGFKVFSSLSKVNENSICITRLHPDYVAEKYNVKSRKCYWLSGCKGKDIISPKSLSQIVRMVKADAKAGKPVVFLDGLEYLLLWNEMNKVIAALGEINTILSATNGTMVICFDPLTLEQNDLKKLWTLYPKMVPVPETEQEEAGNSLKIKEPTTGTGAIA
ncbi:MAG TPA: DUF835 domain-containing protein [Methanomassiliicoccales archaeon]|jgi:hypothetical protein